MREDKFHHRVSYLLSCISFQISIDLLQELILRISNLYLIFLKDILKNLVLLNNISCKFIWLITNEKDLIGIIQIIISYQERLQSTLNVRLKSLKEQASIQFYLSLSITFTLNTWPKNKIFKSIRVYNDFYCYTSRTITLGKS